jgi:hypothetical protein
LGVSILITSFSYSSSHSIAGFSNSNGITTASSLLCLCSVAAPPRTRPLVYKSNGGRG